MDKYTTNYAQNIISTGRGAASNLVCFSKQKLAICVKSIVLLP